MNDDILRRTTNIKQDFMSSPFNKRMILAGMGVIVFFLTGLGFWSYLAPIEGAVVAKGIVSVASQRKSIQHLEGGIVEQIQVYEGAHVRTGELLIKLKDTQQRTQKNQFKAQYVESLALVARLSAQRSGKATIQFPEELQKNKDDPTVVAAMEGQSSVFLSQQHLYNEQLAALKQRQQSFSVEIDAINEQINSGKKQLGFLSEELKVLQKASRLKLIDKTRLLATQGKKSQLEGDISAMRISLAKAHQGMLEARLNAAEAQVLVKKQIDEQLQLAKAKTYELQQQLLAAEDVLQRTKIRSEIDGIVVGLKVHTIGGVIAPGEILLDIVPSHDELLIEASIEPRDIDQVRHGMSALIELTSFNHRYQIPIDGKVILVSADSLLDSITGLAYYKARISLDKESLKNKMLYYSRGWEQML